MLRYVAAATALKFFSTNSITRRMYRFIGNTVGQRQRLAVNDIDIRISRGNLLVDLCKNHNAVKDGDQILEIGTGWMHFYSLYLRMFYELKVIALDIWDNRQFAALQTAVKKLTVSGNQRLSNSAVQKNLNKVIDCRNFDDLYKAFGYEYVIEPTGSIKNFADGQFDFITSFHVLEHVPAELVQELADNMFKKMKPGSLTIHQIGIDDHLTHYDRSASPKQYLQYSDGLWRLLFQNTVQYFNRLQTSDWLAAFEKSGFELVERLEDGVDIGSLEINDRFKRYPKRDLECTTLTLVYRKPI